MTPFFWIAVACDAVLLVVLLVLTLSGSDQPEGGRGMVVFFSIIVPALIVSAGALLFLKSRSPALRAVALLVVAGPGLLVAATRLRSAVIDSHVRRNVEGSGYFSSREMQEAGAAVVRGDAAALRALGKSIDINGRGTDGMTLMELAVTRADDSAGNAGEPGATLDVVRGLIALGADPNAGLKVATKLKDITILSALLDAGAKPGFADEHGPVVFSWLNVMPIAGATALLDHHLDPNLADSDGMPIIVAAAQQDRWNIVLLLMDRGADASRADPHGTRLADVVQSRVDSTSSRPPEMLADIARVKARIGK
jgi:hypothetical protein